jgi:hypothetical protein
MFMFCLRDSSLERKLRTWVDVSFAVITVDRKRRCTGYEDLLAEDGLCRTCSSAESLALFTLSAKIGHGSI